MQTPERKLGPVALAPGISPLHAWVFLFAAFMGISVTTYLSTIQPYLLEVNLGLPADQQGKVSGLALFAGEIVLLVTSSLIGAYSDRIGRRALFAAGLVLLGAGYVLLGFVSSVSTLVAIRMFMSIGISVVNVMVNALMADYPAEQSRGKLVGFVGIAIGFGNILIGVLLLRLPEFYAATGISKLLAGRYTMYTMAALCVFLAVVVRFGLKAGAPDQAAAGTSLRERIAMGTRARRENIRILLAYLCAFVSRGDLVVIGTFLTLWIIRAGIAAGMEPDIAAREAGTRFALVMTAALLWAPVMGWLNDRLDRVVAMALAMGLAAIGYTSVAFLPDPFGPWMYPVGALLGIGQISAVTASQTLIGQEAPAAYRGSVVGMYSMYGAAGILFISSAGGWVFDRVGAVAPFVLIGIANALLCILAIVVARQPRAPGSRVVGT